MHKFEIHFDGGCVPNPGRGYGSYEVRSDLYAMATGAHLYIRLRKERLDFGDRMTNNMAEYQALLCALEGLFQETCSGVLNSHSVPRKNIGIVIFTDSALVRNCLNNGWKVRKPHLQILNQKARDWLKEFGHWTIKWNPRERNVERFGH